MRRFAWLGSAAAVIVLVTCAALLQLAGQAQARDCPYWLNTKTGQRFNAPPPGRARKTLVRVPCGSDTPSAASPGDGAGGQGAGGSN
jgi:hypothetical protein